MAEGRGRLIHIHEAWGNQRGGVNIHRGFRRNADDVTADIVGTHFMTMLSNDGNAAHFWLLQLRATALAWLFKGPSTLLFLWSISAFLLFGFFICHLYRQNVERHFDDLLRAELYHVTDAVQFDDQGALVGTPRLGDLRFIEPKTGWYWIAEPGDNPNARPVVSPSLGASSLPEVPEREASYDDNRERFYEVTDGFGNLVKVVETQVVLTPDGRFARVRVSGNTASIEDEMRDFYLCFCVAITAFLAVGLVILRSYPQTI